VPFADVGKDVAEPARHGAPGGRISERRRLR
jgi:hypothetical protein